MSKQLFVFDVDSTVIKIESLNTILEKAIKDETLAQQMNEICSKALNGEYDYHQSLYKRFYLVNLKDSNFREENKNIEENIVSGIKEIFRYITKNGGEIFLVSGGFYTNILHLGEILGIKKENIYANKYNIKTDKSLEIIDSPLTYVNGKSDVCLEIRKRYSGNCTLTMIGDGITDFNVYKTGAAEYFIGAGYVVSREKVKTVSEYFANTIEELLEIIKKIINKETN